MFTHTHTHTHIVHSGASYSSDMSDIVGTPAATVNELGKTTTPDGVLMSDGSISHTDIVDMPVSLCYSLNV